MRRGKRHRRQCERGDLHSFHLGIPPAGRDRKRRVRRDKQEYARRMTLPIAPVYPPMEAQLVDALPEGEGWQYEPKWDGFRCLAFRDGDDVQLQSKAGQPLARYFPELVALLK